MKSFKFHCLWKHLLVLMILPVNVLCQGNEYLDHNPIWQVETHCAIPLPCIQREDFNYFTGGDTLINGLTYKKILRKGTGVYDWMAPPPIGPGCTGTYTFIDTSATWFVRSYNKQMYIRTIYDTAAAEQLLYDFDLVVGDTLPLTYNNFTSNSATVVSIDSIYTPYGYRKTFQIVTNSMMTYYLIEGIGHSGGFLEIYNYDLNICIGFLNCFSLNDTSWYPLTGLVCDLNVGLDQDLSTDFAVAFPNPFDDFTILSWSSHVENAELALMDLQGKVVRTMTGITGKSTELQREELKPGIYFFVINSHESHHIHTGKVLIVP